MTDDFLLGMVIGASNASVSGAPKPVSIYNGVGVFWSTYVVVAFDAPISSTGLSACYTAFTLKGTEFGVETTYAVTGAEKLDDYRLGLKCADYKNADDYLYITYDAGVAPIQGTSGKLVASFYRQFAPIYMQPKANVIFKIPYIDLDFRHLVTTDTPVTNVQAPVPSEDNSAISFTDISSIGVVNATATITLT